ncbi:MAG: hypothetical protein J6S85_06865 [Methanobrevibacter sp.]|nr:hypothetical protein [Methanobrevibacter sp.]
MRNGKGTREGNPSLVFFFVFLKGLEKMGWFDFGSTKFPFQVRVHLWYAPGKLKIKGSNLSARVFGKSQTKLGEVNVFKEKHFTDPPGSPFEFYRGQLCTSGHINDKLNAIPIRGNYDSTGSYFQHLGGSIQYGEPSIGIALVKQLRCDEDESSIRELKNNCYDYFDRIVDFLERGD